MTTETPPIEVLEGEGKRAAIPVAVIIAAVVMIMFIGIALNYTKPIWLTPPLTKTFLLYLVVGFLWFPALLGSFAFWPKTRRKLYLGFAAVVLVVGICGTLSELSNRFNMNLLIDDFTSCTQGTVPPDRVRYVCQVNLMFYAEIYTFEGIQGSPFMSLIDIKTLDS